jgi:hypothetical protein
VPVLTTPEVEMMVLVVAWLRAAAVLAARAAA